MPRSVFFACTLLTGFVAAQTAPAPAHLPADELHEQEHFYSPYPVFTSQATEVALGVVVRDAKGNPVPGLTQDDFQVTQDGKPIVLKSFQVVVRAGRPAVSSAATPTPAPPPAVAVSTSAAPVVTHHRSVAIYVDDLNLSDLQMTTVRTSGERFLKDGMQPGDRVAILSSTAAGTLDFTTDLDRATKVLDGIVAHPRTHPDGSCPLITPAQAFEITHHFSDSLDDYQFALQQAATCEQGVNTATAILSNIVRNKAETVWDETENVTSTELASLESLVKVLAVQPGDRVLLLASPGFYDEADEIRVSELVNAALHQGVVINSVDAKGLFTSNAVPMGTTDNPVVFGNGPRGNAGTGTLTNYREMTEGRDNMLAMDAMTRLADDTGGKVFENNNDIPKGFQELGEAPGITYLLAYSPQGMASDGAFHKLGVKLSKSDPYEIQVRPGFYAPDKPKAPSAEELQAAEMKKQLDAAVLATDAHTDIEARLTFGPSKDKHGIKVLFEINPTNLPYVTSKGRSQEELHCVLALFNDKGFVTAKEVDMSLDLKADSLAQISTPGVGLKTVTSLDVDPGVYHIRAVIQEGEKGGMYAYSNVAALH